MGILSLGRLSIAAAAFATAMTCAPAQAQFLDGFLGEVQPGGFYFGGALGGISGNGNVHGYPSGGGVVDGSFSPTGLSAGVFGGFDWYWGDILFGIEGDLNIAAAHGAGTGGSSTPYYNYGTDIHAFGSIRKRLGMVFGPWTIYGTGGIGFVSGTFWSEDCYSTCYAQENQPISGVGFTGGAGVQYAVNDMISVRGDVRFFSIPQHEVLLGETSTDTADLTQSFVVATLGVLVHFN